MKNLYNTIEQNLKAGLHVVVKRLCDNRYFAISPNKDLNGNYRRSSWATNVDCCKHNIGECNGFYKDVFEKESFEIVEVYRPEYEPFKAGDKVRILDSIKKTEDWEEVEDYFPNMTGVINQVDFHIIGTNYYINGCYIGHEYLAPLNEVKEETIKIGDHTYSKSEVESRLQGLKEI